MSILNLGKVRITFGGDWDSTNNYETLTVVNNAFGVKYISLQDVPAGIDISDTTYWEPLSGQFVEQYQGPKASDPSVRNDGTALQPGDLYFNTDSSGNVMRIYDGSVWTDITEEKNAGINKTFIDSNTNVEVDRWYVIDTSNDAITITLPGSPNDQDSLRLADGHNNAQNNNVTVDPNGNKLNDSSGNLVCDVNGFYITLVYNNDAGSWYAINLN